MVELKVNSYAINEALHLFIPDGELVEINYKHMLQYCLRQRFKLSCGKSAFGKCFLSTIHTKIVKLSSNIYDKIKITS